MAIHSEKNMSEPVVLIPFVREIPADLETPVSIYLKLRNEMPSFLLESITGGEQLARYSFIGTNPIELFILRNDILEQHSQNDVIYHPLTDTDDPLKFLQLKMSSISIKTLPGLPRFCGGLVGYVGYDIASYYENHVLSTRKTSEEPDLPDAIFLYCETIVAFDHAFGRLLLITNIPVSMNESTARSTAESRLDRLEELICTPLIRMHSQEFEPKVSELKSNTSYEEYILAVESAKEYIAAGDIFQVVLSQRFSRTTSAEAFDIYRSLRRLNPSPYMFFFDFNKFSTEVPFQLIGASPEMHVRLDDQIATVRPIAGTRPRGDSVDEDVQLRNDLLSDPKERAEHVMLVDLARNDLGRVCDYGSIRVPEMMLVENYSHVMHIVSQVEGKLKPGVDSFGLLRSTFPSGTVSGAPKIRAMQIIAELEKSGRGPYAGTVGYFSFDGSMDMCITIRTLVMRGNEIDIQAGAGIVADSDPSKEYQESVNKAKALAIAVEMAENPSYQVRKI